MRKSLFVIASALVGFLPASVSAQRPFHLGLSAGLTPSVEGSVDRGYRGSHLQAALELAPGDRRMGLRLDAFVHDMARTRYPGLSGRTHIVGGTVSALVLMRPLRRSFTPYILAGAGTYRTEYGAPAPEWHFGISGGGGVRFQTGRVAVFTEVRLHQIYDGSTPRLVPLSFGIRF